MQPHVESDESLTHERILPQYKSAQTMAEYCTVSPHVFHVSYITPTSQVTL